MVYQIFLVEDHPVLCQACADVLDDEPDLALCGSAGSAEDALDALATTACDLLVTDVGLPGMDGIALTERMRSDRPDLPVVVISAHDDDVTTARALGAGARAFLPKAGLAVAFPGTLRQVLQASPSGGGTGPPRA